MSNTLVERGLLYLLIALYQGIYLNNGLKVSILWNNGHIRHILDGRVSYSSAVSCSLIYIYTLQYSPEIHRFTFLKL